MPKAGPRRHEQTPVPCYRSTKAYFCQPIPDKRDSCNENSKNSGWRPCWPDIAIVAVIAYFLLGNLDNIIKGVIEDVGSEVREKLAWTLRMVKRRLD